MGAAALQALCDHGCHLLAPRLRSLSLFGSQLWAAESDGERGIPDLFAVVDDGSLAWAAGKLGSRPPRALLRHLPPLTLALSLPTADGLRAKLNLVEITVLRQALQNPKDVYLAGRFSKPMRRLHTRDQACGLEHDALCRLAAGQICTWVLRGQHGSRALKDAIAECAWLSYRGELRPEGPRRLATIFRRNQDEFRDRFTPHLLAAAPSLGLRYDAASDVLIDARDGRSRMQQQRAYARLLWRSRLRSGLRWPKQMLVYRGWAAYVYDKIRRSQRREDSPCHP